MTTLFIFRRDLRLEDNNGLIKALKESKLVIPIFILDPRQVTEKNDYRSINAIQFMFESLKNLNKELQSKHSQLYLFYGIPHKIVEKLIQELSINAVYVNQDYTPFSKQRDLEIEFICKKYKVKFISSQDILLNNPNTILTKQNKPYSIFSYFFKNALPKANNLIQINTYNNYFNKPIKLAEKWSILDNFIKTTNKNIYTKGSRSYAINILENLKDFKDYESTKDYPQEPTTGLSAYIKFGLVSIREVYSAIKKDLGISSSLMRQLYWHDFYTYIIYHNPDALYQSFQQKYSNIKWNSNKTHFDRWKNGNTGFPIIDAGMRQLNTTGFMHNRARLLVSSFLVKDLLINWQLGEKYFAQKEIDYDPSINNGNWQWIASTGATYQPYFRIFNPWTQQKKHDPECKYIKTWVPELKNVEYEKIHQWYKYYDKVNSNYIKPIVDHKEQAIISKRLYKSYS